MKKSIVLIPARYRSTRFPGKPLASILGKPMIIRVAELSAKALGNDNIYVATDSLEIKKVVEDFNFKVIMTSEQAKTGTDRLWEAAQKVKADIYINVQGDEPLLDPEDVLKVLREKEKYPHEVVNAMCMLSHKEDPANVNLPKVVFTEDLLMTYMSRLPVPGTKSRPPEALKYWKQVCIYAFNYDELRAFGTFGRKSYLESLEDIEILRFLELKMSVRMVQTSGGSLAVDVPEDIPLVEKILKGKVIHAQG